MEFIAFIIRLTLYTVVIGVLGSYVTIVQAQEPPQSITKRIERLERNLATLNHDIVRNNKTVSSKTFAQSGPLAVRISLRITDMENEMRALTGQVEEMQFQIKQISKQFDKLTADIDYRLTALERDAIPKVKPRAALLGEKKNFKGTATRPIQPEKSSNTVAVLSIGTLQQQYQQAFSLLQKGNYSAAEKALSAFIEKNKDARSTLVDNAHYWLGETYYVRGNFGQAATTFLDAYAKNPKGNKAPHALFKLGVALANLGKKKEACTTFNKVLNDYPKILTTLRKKVKRERGKEKCDTNMRNG